MATTTIQSLERGLNILIILGNARSPMTLNEIAEHFSIDRSSVFRLIGTLVSSGFVRQDAETKRYTLGYRVLELSGAFSEQSHIESLIRPIMKSVCEATKQNTHLAVLDGSDVVFIAVEQPRDAVTINIAIGTREPSIDTALGRAILAFLQGNALDRTLDGARFTRYTSRSVTDAGELRLILDRVRKERLASDDEEFKPGIFCFAAPIFNHRRETIFSIGISGPVERIKPHSRSFGEIVKKAAIEASGLLGYSG